MAAPRETSSSYQDVAGATRQGVAASLTPGHDAPRVASSSSGLDQPPRCRQRALDGTEPECLNLPREVDDDVHAVAVKHATEGEQLVVAHPQQRQRAAVLAVAQRRMLVLEREQLRIERRQL